ncbi:MAG: thiamine biosynthesis protein ThiF [Phenylobacterium sp.]|uniref:ThiF family adenylyltransferase n=1 Tax=Phenylobacterium sp. TaxID=1871053 RepID=UPI0025DB8FC1|nr:ThiF family adenylyltransferase [Phenylobacterium sp.]MBA4010768.1 thiamine biosynthesis protein ThiF [Phenylobacterium sp.]
MRSAERRPARIVIGGALDARLRTWLTSHPEGHERGAFVFFKKVDRDVQGLERSPRYIAVDAVELDDRWVEDSSPIHLRFSLRRLAELSFRCEQEQLELGFVHSHPDGAPKFSSKDDSNERAILRGHAGASGDSVDLVALILCHGQWLGRVRHAAAPDLAVPARHVLVLSDKMSLWTGQQPMDDEGSLARQAAAFGQPFNRKLRSLRAVVVGLGGTGSPMATLLARCGVGELVLIDGDRLEVTNLNRVRGYRRCDVAEHKAVSLAAYIRSLELGCRVAYLPEFIDVSPAAIDAIATADVVFGCTDDVAGRDILNQSLYYYALPLIDVGLTGIVAEAADGMPYLRDHRGRISTVLPEAGACLRCQGVVTEEKLKAERAFKARPELAQLDPETLKREYYLVGGHESAPGIGPFTSATADHAAAGFMNLIQPFRKLGDELRQDNIWIDFVHLGIYSNEPRGSASCFCCGADGLRAGSEGPYRLSMPKLGRAP